MITLYFAAVNAHLEPIQALKIPKAETLVNPGFNGALYSAKAFGIATTLVTIGAFVGVWGCPGFSRSAKRP